MDGLLLVDKPSGMTSHDVVDCIRKGAKQRRVGHTGTLDPAATGLMILCLGAATRLSEHLTRMDKVYEGEMTLGVETDSYDLQGTVIAERPVPELSSEELQAACNVYVGSIEQIPPMVSAVKVGGERLYKLARKGEEVERQPRKITVHEFSVLKYTAPVASFRVTCTSGTYVRSLCHDVGADLGCGAVLSQLRRTAVGIHHIDGACALDQLETPEQVAAALASLDDALSLPVAVVNAEGERRVASGNAIEAKHLLKPSVQREKWIQIKTSKGRLIALAQPVDTPNGPALQPRRVLQRP